MNLYLVRHGDYVSSDIDHLEPLSKEGMKKTEQVANFLQPSLYIDEIYCSTKLRAQQTAEVFKKIAAPHLTLTIKDYLGPTAPIYKFLEDIQINQRNILVVTHQPFIERVLNALLFQEEVLSFVDICPSCCVCLNNQNQDWHIVSIVTPSLFKPNLPPKF